MKNTNFSKKMGSTHEQIFHRKCVNSGLSAVAHPCNPSVLGGQGRQIMRLGDRDHAGSYGKTTSLLKIQKLAGHDNVHL